MTLTSPNAFRSRIRSQGWHLGRTIAGSLLALVFAGCSNSLALSEVEGTVILDGQPVPNAIVEFQPARQTKEIRPSIGETDANGKFRLRFSQKRWGAVPGTHKVLITTYSPSGSGVFKERIPASYNSNSTLVRSVEPKANWIDFHLYSNHLGPALTSAE